MSAKFGDSSTYGGHESGKSIKTVFEIYPYIWESVYHGPLYLGMGVSRQGANLKKFEFFKVYQFLKFLRF